MAKIMVIQHSPFEPLGIIIDTLKHKKIRIRYVNFHRNPNERPNLKGYRGLIILGGTMNPDELPAYPHLRREIELIKEALSNEIPTLGICLGSQLLNIALGGHCYSLEKPEFGWTEVNKIEDDALFSAFPKRARVFQWHQYACQLAPQAKLIIDNKCCPQAFMYKDYAVGLQFHLEIDSALIYRWLGHPDYLTHLKSKISAEAIEQMRVETKLHLNTSMHIAEEFFRQFCRQFQKHSYSFSSMHAGKALPKQE